MYISTIIISLKETSSLLEKSSFFSIPRNLELLMKSRAHHLGRLLVVATPHEKLHNGHTMVDSL